MMHDDPNPSAAAPARALSSEVSGEMPGGETKSDAGYPPPPGPLGQPEPSQIPGGAPEFDASVPEDLRTPWGWVDLILFLGFGLGGLLIVGGIVFAVAALGFGVSLSDVRSMPTSPTWSMIAVLIQGLWSGLMLLYFLVLVRVRTPSPFWRTMGWRELHLAGHATGVSAVRCLVGGAMLALVMSFAGRFLQDKGELPIEQMFHSRATVILFMSFGILVAPLVEETMFRGFLYPVIARQFGVGVSVIVTGILFGAMHAQQLGNDWGQIGLLMLVGIALTWVRARSGTVTASYFVHLGYNSLLFLGFFAATGGLRHIPGGS